MPKVVDACWYHPKQVAVAILNMGTVLDFDTPVCAKCVKKIKEDIRASNIDKRATLRMLQ